MMSGWELALVIAAAWLATLALAVLVLKRLGLVLNHRAKPEPDPAVIEWQRAIAAARETSERINAFWANPQF